MPGINVSALTGGDLRRLLKIAQARKDGLLADRLEWEIAARATRVVRPPAAFATLPDDDDYDEWAEREPAPEAEPYAPAYSDLQAASQRRRVALVSLTALVGALLSAGAFWGLARMDGFAGLVGDAPHPTRVMSLRSAGPTSDPVIVARAPEALPAPPPPVAPRAAPILPEAAAVTVAPPRPAPTPVVELATEEPPAKPVLAKREPERSTPAAKVETVAKTEPATKKPAARKDAPAKTELAAKAAAAEKPAATDASAKERKPRPPTLDEWLAGSGPTPR